MNPYTKNLSVVQEKNSSNLCLRLNPIPEFLPLEVVTRWDEPLLPYNKAIINATSDIVCAYQLSLAHYLHWGAAGIIALERTIGYISADIPIILDCRMAVHDAALAGLLDGAFVWGADAVVVSEQSVLGDGLQQMENYPDKYFYLLGKLNHGFCRESLVSAENIGYAFDKPSWRSVAGVRAAASSAQFLLMDGVGDVPQLCIHSDCEGGRGVLSFGRKILYASAGLDWADACRTALLQLRTTINDLTPDKK